MADQQLAEGQQEEQFYRQNGVGDADIDQWKQGQVEMFHKNGVSDKDINDYFGVKEPDTSDIKSYVDKNVQDFKAGRVGADGKPLPHEASTFGEALQAAWQGSDIGTFMREKGPDVIAPEHQGFAMRMTEKVAQLGLDSPFMALGGMAGGAIGATGGAIAGTALGSLPGTAAGAIAGGTVGAGFGAFAAPPLIRQMLMDHYNKENGVKDPSTFMEHLGAYAYTAVQNGLPGAALAATGGLIGPVSGVAATGGKLAAEYASMIGTQGAMAGQLPSYNEFIDGAVMMGGFHLATGGLPTKLREIYAKTGERPADVAEAAATDGKLAGEMDSVNPDLPKQAAPEAEEGEPESIPVEQKEPKEGEEEDDLAKARKGVLARLAQDQETSKPSWLTPSGFMQNLSDQWDKIYDSTVNKFYPLKSAEDAAGFESENGGFDSPYVRALNSKAWRGKLQRALQFNTIDYKTGQVNGEGLVPILKDIKPEDQADFMTFALSKRALERDQAGQNGEGKETGINLDDAQKIVDADGERFGDTFKRLEGFQNRMLKYAKDSELISKDSYNKILQESKNYLPLLRQQDMDEFLGKPPEGKGQIAPFMKGSEKKILDPIQSIYGNTERIFQAAEQNAVPLNFVNMVEKAENGFAIAEKVEKPTGASNEFTFKRAGEEETWKTMPRYAEGLKALNYDPGLTNAFLKLLMAPGSWLRLGTVDTPDFLSRHFIRQVSSGSVYSQSVKIPFLDSAKYVWNTMRSLGDAMGSKSEDFQKYLSSGATAGTMSDFDSTVGKVWQLNKESGNWLDKTFNVLKTAKQGIEWAAFVADTPQRLAEFKSMGGTAEGADIGTITKAASAAREVTLDYDRSGAQTKVMRALTPFMNIGIQGTDRLVRGFKDDPVGMSTKAAMAITLPTVINWAINHKDSRYTDAPQWEKDLYWLFPTDKWEKAASPDDAMARPEDLRRQLPDGTWEVNNGTTVKISKPFELGVLFGSLPERLLSKYFDKNPHQLSDFVSTVLHGVTPNVIPTALLPVMETATNHNMFMDRPIIPDNLKNVAPEYQYTNYTSGAAKALGSMLGYVPGLHGTRITSPLVIDNWIREWSGTGGQYALKIANAVQDKTSLDKNIGARPAWNLSDTPFVQAFISRNPSHGMQPIQDFYDAYNKAEGVSETYKTLMRQGNTQAAEQYLAQNRGDSVKLQPIHQALGAQAALIRGITTNPQFSADEKRQLIDKAYYQMWTMAKMGVKILNENKEAFAAAAGGGQ